MRILVLNGSPQKSGTVATLLKEVVKGVAKNHQVEWVDIYDLKMEHCVACMKCRPDGECILPPDDAHRIGQKIKDADGLIIGTPTHWGNMSAKLKLLLDRNVPVFMGESPRGIPIARQQGKPAVIVVACTTPWPFNMLAGESSGAIRAVREVLHYGGYKIVGKIVKPGTKNNPILSGGLLEKAYSLGCRFK